MSDVIHLPGNIIGKADRDRLESFGGHTIAHGRATRWHWDRNADGDEVFEIYRGGKDEALVARISRDRQRDLYCVHGSQGGALATGALECILAELDGYLARLHRTGPGPAA